MLNKKQNWFIEKVVSTHIVKKNKQYTPNYYYNTLLLFINQLLIIKTLAYLLWLFYQDPSIILIKNHTLNRTIQSKSIPNLLINIYYTNIYKEYTVDHYIMTSLLLLLLLCTVTK